MTTTVKALFLLASLAVPSSASAHTSIEGVENFYSGLLHPVFVPAQLLLLIALGLFIGQRGAAKNQVAIAALLVATVVGLFAAWFELAGEIQVYLFSGAAITGLLVASNLALSPYGCALITSSAGLIVGLDSAQETLSGVDKLVALSGSGVGIFLIFLYSMILAERLSDKNWKKIGVRIMGSWLAASSLLVLVLEISAKSQPLPFE
jgi:urease accessory protein